MKYNRLGKAGIKVSELSFGSWLTFGKHINVEVAKNCMRAAFEYGVNFFDNAEVYARGLSESVMAQLIKEYRREDLVVSTKIFWGGDGPNDKGLSWKHLVEGTKNSLKRLDVEYVDLLFCHRPDPETPIEETVRAMDHIIRSGWAFYWGTSEWSAEELKEAYAIAEKYHCIPPTMEQPQYHMFHRDRVEKEYAQLYKEHGLGTTIWSPLASGILTGKYNDGIPENSRLQRESWLAKELTEEKLNKVRKLTEIAGDLGCSMAQLAIAWCLANPNVSTVITGATSIEQVTENMKAVAVKSKLTPEVMTTIENILN